MSDDIAMLSAVAQSKLIAKRELSPVELVRTSLDRIERFNPKLCAYITVCTDAALAAAREAEREIMAGRYRGPLHGLPFGVKDQLHASGVRTTLGSRVTGDEPAAEDACCIARLKAAGAILIGKENLHEFGKGGTHEFTFGQPRNPWNLAFNPAGSSSGSGIAPASGMSSFSLGEDTGGSVRSPAAANGVVGLRPTFGRVPRHGGVMYGWTADTIGPLARCVEDVAMVLGAIAGCDPRDPLSADKSVPDYRAGLTGSLSGMRLGVVREMAFPEGVHPDVRAALEQAIEVLRALGARVEEMSLARARYSVPLQLLTSDADIAAMFVTKWLRTRWNDLDVGTRQRIGAAALIPAAVYARANRARVLVRREILDACARYDALVCATSLSPPGPIDAARETVTSKDDMRSKVLLRRIGTYPFSMANVPAIAVPMGFSRQGLPLSLQIAAQPFAEASVFKVAHAYECATPWHERHPDVAGNVATFISASAHGPISR